MIEHDCTPFDQAVTECALERAWPLEVLQGLVADDEDGRAVSELLAEVTREQIACTTPMQWATATALLALAVGAKAERIRQRRHGDHKTEVIEG